MKRSALLFGALMLGAASGANAQGLTMQMSNGWTFSFAGNVNAFMTYESEDEDGDLGASPLLVLVGTSAKNARIRTGLLPAFATFAAKGKEGNTDLGVHFGFAPQINCSTGTHDCFGAQIDMRQVFLTVGGSWGQILAGRELGLFGRQNILNDQTLFGVGGTGNNLGGGGTTLGRIGFGYIYPQFKAQFTYSTAGGKSSQLSIGLFESSVDPTGGPYTETNIPRVEAEWTYTASSTKFWVGGLAQSVKDPASGGESATSFGASGGVRYSSGTFSLTGSGYYGKGLGTTLLFAGSNTGTGSGSDDMTKSYGYIGQFTFTPTNSKTTFAGSYGSSFLKNSEDVADFKLENTLISGGIYHQATKSLKLVGEFNYNWSKEHESDTKNTGFTPAVGLMLFF